MKVTAGAADSPGAEIGRADSQALCGAAVIAIAALALTGWVFGVAILSSVFLGLSAMNPLTALLFLMVGLVLSRSMSQALMLPTGLLLGLMGLFRLLSYAGWDLGLDTLMFRHALEAHSPPNRMAPNTSVGFIMTGLALAFLTRRDSWSAMASQSLALAAVWLSIFAMLGYAYRAPRFYGIGTFMPMALNTAICFALVNSAILLVRRGEGWMACVSNDGPGGIMTRRMLPFTLLLPAFLGFLKLKGHWGGWYDTETGTTLFVIALIAAFSGLVWYTALLLGRIDTERKYAEEKTKQLVVELQERAAELAIVNKELESFSYSVSHDLRAPLRTVDGFSQVILEDYADRLDDQGKDSLNRIRQGCQQMGQLIDDLINLSRVIRHETRMQKTDLSVIAKSVMEELKNADRSREVEFTAPACVPVIGDAGLLRAVLENLLGNAWKFTGRKKDAKIEFGVTQNNGETIYFVKDNGAGFDMAYANKLFGAFQRLHSQEEFPGTGIGLATTQRIVHRHGGRIWAEGAVEKGAVFYFSLNSKGGPDGNK